MSPARQLSRQLDTGVGDDPLAVDRHSDPGEMPLPFTLNVPFCEVAGSAENPHSSLRDGHFRVSREVNGHRSAKRAG